MLHAPDAVQDIEVQEVVVQDDVVQEVVVQDVEVQEEPRPLLEKILKRPRVRCRRVARGPAVGSGVRVVISEGLWLGHRNSAGLGVRACQLSGFRG